jgi:uncharacterized protein
MPRRLRSRYTLGEPWADGRGILLNGFSGAVDIVPREAIDFVAEHREAELDPNDPLHATLLERGYYVHSREVEDAYARHVARRAKARARASGQPKYMFGLTLKCNLACHYCWQVVEHGSRRQRTPLMSEAMVDAAFELIDRDLERRRRQDAFVSLFGGEPLIDHHDFRNLVNAVGQRTAERGKHLHFTTNGRDLAAYRDEIHRFGPSIQVTVDGAEVSPAQVVLTRAGQRLDGVFETLAEIMAEGRAATFLRFLASPATVPQFVALADRIFATPCFDDGFTLAVAPIQNKAERVDPAIPPKFRVLELLMEALRDRSYSSRIAFVDWRSLRLFDHLRAGEEALPSPSFFHCEANLELMCFGHDGRLYACYEAIGDPALSVGRYWPEVEIDEAHLAQYRDRSAFAMPECSECALSPICGGGCEVRGIKHNGTYMRPYCDALHAEARLVLRNWQEVSELLIGGTHAP